MPSLKMNEIVSLSKKEIFEKILNLKKELFDLKMQNSVKKLANPLKIRSVKLSIARLMTELNNKNFTKID